jgi:hypothetical protein
MSFYSNTSDSFWIPDYNYIYENNTIKLTLNDYKILINNDIEFSKDEYRLFIKDDKYVLKPRHKEEKKEINNLPNSIPDDLFKL